MAFKKVSKHERVAEKLRLQVIFKRMTENMRMIRLHAGDEGLRCVLAGYDEESLFVECTRERCEKHHMLPPRKIPVSFSFEGKEYYGGLQIKGVGRFEGQDALRLTFPPFLHIRDDFGLTTLHLFPRRKATFTSTLNQFCQGWIVNIGSRGVDVKCEDGAVRDHFAVDFETTLGFELDNGIHIACQGRVLYFQAFEGDLAGIEFLNLNRDTQGKVESWIGQQSHSKSKHDMEYLRAPIVVRKRSEADAKARLASKDSAEDDSTVFCEGEPRVLILSHDEGLIHRMAKVIGRKYGVLISKGRFSHVRNIIDTFHPRLILIQDQLGSVSGFDLTRTIAEHTGSNQPILIMGEQDDAEKRNLAVQCGAIDLVPLVPFKPLGLFQKVHETLMLFGDETL